jgi:hypothetical protein
LIDSDRFDGIEALIAVDGNRPIKHLFGIILFVFELTLKLLHTFMVETEYL